MRKPRALVVCLLKYSRDGKRFTPATGCRSRNSATCVPVISKHADLRSCYSQARRPVSRATLLVTLAVSAVPGTFHFYEAEGGRRKAIQLTILFRGNCDQDTTCPEKKKGGGGRVCVVKLADKQLRYGLSDEPTVRWAAFRQFAGHSFVKKEWAWQSRCRRVRAQQRRLSQNWGSYHRSLALIFFH